MACEPACRAAARPPVSGASSGSSGFVPTMLLSSSLLLIPRTLQAALFVSGSSGAPAGDPG